MDQISEEQSLGENSASIQSQFFKKNSIHSVDSSKTVKSYSPIRRKRNDEYLFRTKFMKPQPIEQSIKQTQLNENFDFLFKNIKKISLNDESSRRNLEMRFIVSPTQLVSKELFSLNSVDGVGITKASNGYKQKSKSMATPRIQRNGTVPVRTAKNTLDISTIVGKRTLKDEEKDNDPVIKMIMKRKSRYKAMLQPLRKGSLSNNVKDYLSVEKISIRDIEDALTPRMKQTISFQSPGNSNLLNTKEIKSLLMKEFLPAIKPTIFPKKKFTLPFQVYYYRDFVWRAGFSNGCIVEVPNQYTFKVKIYVGKGNNSMLLKGIAMRRVWYQITDKIQEANIVWTQIKSASYMSMQKCTILIKDSQKFSQKRQISYTPANSILNAEEEQVFQSYWKQHSSSESKINQQFTFRNRQFKIKPIKLPQIEKIKIHNHFRNNFIIGNKKALFYTMSVYYKSTLQNIFDHLPLTFHVKNGIQDDQYLQFLKYFYQENKKSKKQQPGKPRNYNIWIIKPGQLTNQGAGIQVCLNLQEIKTILKKKEKHADGTIKTHIIQKYIQRPLLYKKRKFDLRHYILITCLNGVTKGYWCQQGYVRTTSAEYTLKFGNESVHLTNDAVQKSLPDYGKFEKGNKISYDDLHIYLSRGHYKLDFWKKIYPKMKKLGTDIIRASASSLDPDRKNNFQLFGLDFMIDENFDVWLIEVNTNPNLEVSCPVLRNVIPKVIQNAFKLFLDPIFPAPKESKDFNLRSQVFYKNCVEENCFQLVYDEREYDLKAVIKTELKFDKKLQQEEQDTFEDDGEDWTDD